MPETENLHVLEPVKPSKLGRIKSAAATTAIFVIPTALVAGSMYATYKMTAMQLETAQLNLEAARLTA